MTEYILIKTKRTKKSLIFFNKRKIRSIRCLQHLFSITEFVSVTSLKDDSRRKPTPSTTGEEKLTLAVMDNMFI